MFEAAWKPFVHPAGVYRLEYPGHWDHLQKDEARSCGFGPHERDDVGLWISILPISLDTDRLAEDFPQLMREALPHLQTGEFHPDPTLRHHGLKADLRKDGEGGHYWLVAGGDIVLLASTQVPFAERDAWNPAFERVMASLQITRDEELFVCKLANEVLEKLRRRFPDQEFRLDAQGIRGKNRVVFLSNLACEVRAAPARRHEIVRHFVDSLGQCNATEMGHETWQEACARLMPMLKPRDYQKPGTPTEHQFSMEWLGDVAIYYALRVNNIFRYVTNWDVQRWEKDAAMVHQVALDNLEQLGWPSRLEGSRQRDGGRIILVATPDGVASSRLLHPDLHRLFSGPLGSPFFAGVPDRDTLVLFSDRRGLKQRIGRQLRKDHRTSAYPITPQPFLVTQDGIAPGPR
jgi:uncharacterized protein YtpQ (UPF0354 family)